MFISCANKSNLITIKLSIIYPVLSFSGNVQVSTVILSKQYFQKMYAYYLEYLFVNFAQHWSRGTRPTPRRHTLYINIRSVR